MRRAAGFTLLEAVVALAIFTTGATALYTWINSELIALNRIYASAERTEDRENAIEFMQAINPSDTPSGETEFGDMKIHWQATETMSGVVLDDHGGRTINNAAIYDTHVSIYRDEVETDAFNVMKIGLTGARENSEGLFQ